MATLTKSRQARKPAKKPERHVHLYDGTPALLEMTIGKECFSYWLKSIPADFGLGFEVRKLLTDGGDVYHVHYDPARRVSTCDCLGGLHHGHCKHQEAVVALIQSGKIAVPAPKPEAKQPWCDVCNDNPDVYCPRCSL